MSITKHNNSERISELSDVQILSPSLYRKILSKTSYVEVNNILTRCPSQKDAGQQKSD